MPKIKMTIYFLVFSGCIFFAQPALAWEHVQSNGQNTSLQETNSLAFASDNTAGNLIIVQVDFTGTADFVSISDTQGNIYTEIGTEQTAWGAKSRLYYAKNIIAGTNTVTTELSSGPNYHELWIHEYSGLDKTSPLDSYSIQTAENGETRFTSGNVTTTGSDEMLYGIEIDTGTSSADFNWTVRSTLDANVAADRHAHSPGNYAYTGTTSSGYIAWIVAFRPPPDVFYSVGQTTDDLMTGSPTMTITDGIAVFDTAQTGNIGVGDRVTYDGSIIAYIAAKTDADQKHWKLTTATGEKAPDITGATVTSIKREYTSLSAAVAGASDSNHLDNADLTDVDVILNFPCYYDSGPDTAAVEVNGYTTGPANYIRVYTPNDTSTEVNISQRHEGKWDESKYRIEYSNGTIITANEEFVRIDGLQLRTSYIGASNIFGIWGNASGTFDFQVSNNIVRGIENTGGGYLIGIVPAYSSGSGTAEVWNNIVYDFRGPNGEGVELDDPGTTAYFYNNTVYHNNIGIYSHNGGVFVAKNNISYSNSDNYGSDLDSSSTNNLSGPGSDAQIPTTNARNGVTVNFIDPSNGDFHLSSTDTNAKSFGGDLSQDVNLAFETDIDSEPRSGKWSIGADEPPGAVAQSSAVGRGGLSDGLVLYQTFDGVDISGTTANDRSNIGNDGTIYGATSVIGKRGQGMSFDGVSNRIGLGSSSSLQPANVTVSYWLKRTSSWTGVCGNAIVWTKGSGWAGDGWYIETNDRDLGTGLIMVVDGDNAFYVPEHPDILFPLNEWVHIAATFNSTTHAYAMYINGVSQTVSTLRTPGTITGTGDTKYIGYKPADDVYLDGQVDEVRVYDRVLSPDEVGRLYRLGGETINTSQKEKVTGGLTGHWTFDGPDVSGLTAYDRSDNDNDGTISGATLAIGKKGQGVSFDGTDDHIDMGDITIYSPDNKLSVSYWVKPKNAETWQAHVSKWNAIVGSINNQWAVRTSNSDPKELLVFIADSSDSGDNYLLTSGLDLRDDEWASITIVFDGEGLTNADRLKLYKDGVQQAGVFTGTIPSAFNGSDASTDIGRKLCSDPNQKFFRGTMDEVRIYNKALSADEVGDLFRLGEVKIKK